MPLSGYLILSALLFGMGVAGVWCLLARPLAPIGGATVVDMNGFNVEDDAKWARNFFIQLIRRVGDIHAALALTTPAPLCIHNLHRNFPTGWVRDVYAAAGAKERLLVQRRAMKPEAIAGALDTIRS